MVSTNGTSNVGVDKVFRIASISKMFTVYALLAKINSPR